MTHYPAILRKKDHNKQRAKHPRRLQRSNTIECVESRCHSCSCEYSHSVFLVKSAEMWTTYSSEPLAIPGRTVERGAGGGDKTTKSMQAIRLCRKFESCQKIISASLPRSIRVMSAWLLRPVRIRSASCPRLSAFLSSAKIRVHFAIRVNPRHLANGMPRCWR